MNAFCNSYQYDHHSRSLYIHHSRILTSGDFGLVMVHALSHIKLFPETPDRWNDQNPQFIGEFYKNLRILSQDLYKRSMVGVDSFPAMRDGVKTIGSLSRQFSGSVGLSRSLSSRRNHLIGQDEESTPVSSQFFSMADSSEKSLTSKSLQNETSFEPDSMENRIKTYVRMGGLPTDFAQRYASTISKANP